MLEWVYRTLFFRISMLNHMDAVWEGNPRDEVLVQKTVGYCGPNLFQYPRLTFLQGISHALYVRRSCIWG